MCENMLSYTKLTDGSFTEFLGALQWELYGKEAHADSTLTYLDSPFVAIKIMVLTHHLLVLFPFVGGM